MFFTLPLVHRSDLEQKRKYVHLSVLLALSKTQLPDENKTRKGSNRRKPRTSEALGAPIISLTISLCLIIPSFATASIQTDILCLSSLGEKPIKLEFKRFYETETSWVGGYVKYSTSKEITPIVLELTESTPTSDTSPDDTTSTWLEIKSRKITGSYEVSSQGGNTYNFMYDNFETKESINFIVDPNTDYSESSGCLWNNSDQK